VKSQHVTKLVRRRISSNVSLLALQVCNQVRFARSSLLHHDQKLFLSLAECQIFLRYQ
jgi:hypothetical protein